MPHKDGERQARISRYDPHLSTRLRGRYKSLRIVGICNCVLCVTIKVGVVRRANAKNQNHEELKMKRNKYEIAVVQIDHQLFEDQVATTTPQDSESTQLSQQLKDGYAVDPAFITGKLAVGEQVTFQETPCPMCNCNGWCSRTPISGTIIFLGSEDQLMKLWAQEPTYTVWYWVQ